MYILSWLLFCFCFLPNPSFTATSPLSSWNLVTNPAPFSNTGGLLHGYDSVTNRIWLIAGYGLNEIWYYDLTQNKFFDVGSLPYSVSANAQSYTQLGRSIYFTYSGTVREFSMSTGSLTSLNSAMTYNRDSPCVTNDGRYLFLVGGGAGAAAAIQFLIYDTQTGSWSAGQSVLAKSRAACAVHSGYLYRFGGTFNNDPVTATNIDPSIHYVYVGNSGNFGYAWTELTNSQWLVGNNYFARAVPVGDYIYIVGGRDTTLAMDRTVQLFDPGARTIQTVVSANVGRSSPSVQVVEGIIFLFGQALSWEYSNVLIPTEQPTKSPTETPSENPTTGPTNNPTVDPTSDPSANPTGDPTTIPTEDPTLFPTGDPTNDPITDPTTYPTLIPTTPHPTSFPSARPSNPTKSPTGNEGGEVVETTLIAMNDTKAGEMNKNSDGSDNKKLIGFSVVFAVLFVICVCVAFFGCRFIYRSKQKHITSMEKNPLADLPQTNETNQTMERADSGMSGSEFSGDIQMVVVKKFTTDLNGEDEIERMFDACNDEYLETAGNTVVNNSVTLAHDDDEDSDTVGDALYNKTTGQVTAGGNGP